MFFTPGFLTGKQDERLLVCIVWQMVFHLACAGTAGGLHAALEDTMAFEKESRSIARHDESSLVYTSNWALYKGVWDR